MKIARSLLLATALCVSVARSQTSPEILASDIRTHIKYLASTELAGRATGSVGNRKAAEYIAGFMQREGVVPAGDSGTYFQTFEFVSSVRLGEGNRMHLATNQREFDLRLDDEFLPLGFSSNAEVSGQIIFAGYGISAMDLNYDDYAGLDVAGKVVVVLRYGPDGSLPQSPFAKYTSFRNKARVARDKGAAAIIFVSGPNDDRDEELVKLGYDHSFESSGIPAVSMKRAVLDQILQNCTLKSVQDSIAAHKKPWRAALVPTTVLLRTSVQKIKGTTANVVGILPGNDPTLAAEVLVLGAHFDHLGFGGIGSGSLVPDSIVIHSGADDNASGTAGLMEIMESLANTKQELKRSVLFIFFSGEELGTLGSTYFVGHPTLTWERFVAMLNMDMVGHLEGNALTVYGTGTSSVWPGLLDRLNREKPFNIKSIADGYGPSDQSVFYAKDLPVLFFFTGTHDEYHKPSDTWDKIHYEGEEAVVRFVRSIALSVDTEAKRPDFTRVAASPGMATGDTRGYSVTLGIVPDFAEGIEGMKIGGIKPKGPAELAGLKAGDVIVRMAGKKVMNIYDYMGVLSELKAGDIVEIVAQRDGSDVIVKATMQKRK